MKAFEVTEEVLAEAEECGALGLTLDQTAWNLGINPSTLYRNKVKSAALQSALTRGQARGIRNMTGCLRDQAESGNCLLYTSPSPRDRQKSRMPSSA